MTTIETTTPRDIEQEIAERFRRDVAGHVMTVLHDDGVYRHLRFSRPASSICWFELVTRPGSLCIRGDMGAHVFARLPDMFAFFRRPSGKINAHYWAEKLPDYGRSVRLYSEDTLRAKLAAALAEYEPEQPDQVAAARSLIAEYDADGLLYDIEGARDLLAELERDGLVSDTWEWNLTDWDRTYLWCCHAIVWGIAAYDAGRQPVQVGGEDR